MTGLLTSKYISVGVTYISWFSDFALYLEYYLLDKCHTWDISSLWPDYWRQNISLLVWPIFHGSVILPYILNTICWINVTPGILVPCDPMNDHSLYLGHCDLYFMVQWFCLISWILTYISCFSDFAFYFYYYFMENCHTSIIISMWQNDLHTNTSRSVWPILYGLMIKMLQYKMYPAGELAVLRQLLFFLQKLYFYLFSISFSTFLLLFLFFFYIFMVKW